MKGSKIISFIAGATIGSVVTWYLTKTKYQQIADEEAESFRTKLADIKKELKKEEKVYARNKMSKLWKSISN